MALLDFLKKIISKNKAEPEKEPEKLDFNKIDSWTGDKEEEIENKKNQVLVLIKDKTNEFVSEIDEKLKILGNVDVESKKAEEKLKLITKENLNNYIGYARSLKEETYNLKEENLDKFAEKLGKIFSNFDKRSNLSYHKATILIGKEVAAVKEGIINFYKSIRKIFDESKEVIESLKIISQIKQNLIQIKEIDENLNKINRINTSLDKEITNLKEINKKSFEDIEKIKESKDYLENSKKIGIIKSTEKKLEKEIYKLKSLINFKALTNILHVNPKKLALVKEYKENFQELFLKDNGEIIINLLSESNLNNEKISNKVKQINEKRQEINEAKKLIKEDKTLELSEEIKKSELEIENLNSQGVRELKTSGKFKANRKELIKSIKKYLKKMDVVLLDED